MSNDGFAFRHRLDVRFRDCDSMGHVNNAVYFTYLEQCRLTFWRQLTGDGSPLARVIVARAECDYRSPAVFGDQLEVRLTVGEIGRSSFVAASIEIVHLATGRRLADGKTVMVTLRLRGGASVPIPPATERSNVAVRS